MTPSSHDRNARRGSSARLLHWLVVVLGLAVLVSKSVIHDDGFLSRRASAAARDVKVFGLSFATGEQRTFPDRPIHTRLDSRGIKAPHRRLFLQKILPRRTVPQEPLGQRATSKDALNATLHAGLKENKQQRGVENGTASPLSTEGQVRQTGSAEVSRSSEREPRLKAVETALRRKKRRMLAVNNRTNVNRWGRPKNTSPPHFRGVERSEDNEYLFRVDNITRLSHMFYRIVKAHNISSVLDIPCTDSIIWMPEVLERLEFESSKFEYRCMVPDNEKLVDAVLRFSDLDSAMMMKEPEPGHSKLPKVDLALAWYIFGYYSASTSWKLLQAFRDAGIRYAIIPNYPDVRHNSPHGNAKGKVNVRRSPYRFGEPFRIVNDMNASTSQPKQLLFYELHKIRSQGWA